MEKRIICALCLLCISIQAQKWEWAYNGGGDYGYAITCDITGNIYSLSGGNGPFGGSNLQATSTSILAKQNTNNYVIWANALVNLEPIAIAVDDQSNCFLTGRVTLFSGSQGI